MWDRAVLLTALALLCVVAKRREPRLLCSDIEPLTGDVISQLSGNWVTLERMRLPRGPVVPRRRNSHLSPTCVSMNVTVNEGALSVVTNVHKLRRDVITYTTNYSEREKGRWALQSDVAVKSSEIMVLSADPTSYMVLLQCKQLRRTGVIEPCMNVPTTVTLYSRGGREEEEEAPRRKGGRRRNKGKRKHWKGRRWGKKWGRKWHVKKQDIEEDESSNEGKGCGVLNQEGDIVGVTENKDCKEVKKVSSEEKGDSVEETNKKCKGRKKGKCEKRKSNKGKKHHDSSSEEHSKRHKKSHKKHKGKKWNKHDFEKEISVEITESDEIFNSNEDNSNEFKDNVRTSIGNIEKEELDGYDSDDEESSEKSKRKSKKVRRDADYLIDSAETLTPSVETPDFETNNSIIEDPNVTENSTLMYKPLSKLQIDEIREFIKLTFNIDRYESLMLSTDCYNVSSVTDEESEISPVTDSTENPVKLELGNEIPGLIDSNETSEFEPEIENGTVISVTLP